MSLVNCSIRRAAFVAVVATVAVFAGAKKGQCGVTGYLTVVNASSENVTIRVLAEAGGGIRTVVNQQTIQAGGSGTYFVGDAPSGQTVIYYSCPRCNGKHYGETRLWDNFGNYRCVWKP